MRVSYMELLGERHPMCFSLAASEALSEHFGSLEQMEEELTCGEVHRVSKAADKVLQILLKAGRIYASACGEELPKALPCRPADLIDVRDGGTLKSIFAAISADTEREVETQPKNGEATQDK